MKNLENRLSRLETALAARYRDNEGCGRGVRVIRKMAAEGWTNSCSRHGRRCWERESAVEMAGAIMLLEQLDKVRNAVRAGTSWGLAWEAAKLDGGVDIANPPAWLVEQCREELLAQGAELLAEEDE